MSKRKSATPSLNPKTKIPGDVFDWNDARREEEREGYANVVTDLEIIHSKIERIRLSLLNVDEIETPLWEAQRKISAATIAALEHTITKREPRP